MSQDLAQLKSQIQKTENVIAGVITPSLVRRYFPNDPERFGEDPLAKTFGPEEIQAIDEAARHGDSDPEMIVLDREGRLLMAENISQVVLTRYKQGEVINEQERFLYSRVNQLGSLHDELRQSGRTRKETRG